MATEFLPTSSINRYYFTQYIAARTVADGVLNSSTTVTSATAAFTSLDVGATITGTGIPVAATIASVTNGTTVVISAAATATSSSVSLTITRTNTNALSGFQAALVADWGPSGTIAQVLPAGFQVLATTAAPSVAVLIINSNLVLSVSPSQWAGLNAGNWQVLPNSSMSGSVFTPASV